MNLSDINPHIRYAATHYFLNSAPFDSICYDCRLFFMEKGTGRVVANGSEYHFSDNTALYFPAGTKYHFYPGKSCSSFVCVVIDFDLVNDFSHLSKSLGTAAEHNFLPGRVIQYPMPPEFSSVLIRTAPSVANLLDKCCEEFLVQNPLYREIASAFLKLCLLDLVRNLSQGKALAKITPVIDYIHANYADASLSNASIAKLFNYHPYYLSQMIRQYTGQSLHQYLIAYRIRMAKKKLVTTDDPISTVAWKTGFPSPAYFTAQFKEKVGVTPNVYRKEHIHFLL